MINVHNLHIFEQSVVSDVAFHKSDGMTSSGGGSLDFGKVNGFRAEIRNEETQLLSWCGLVNASSDNMS